MTFQKAFCRGEALVEACIQLQCRVLCGRAGRAASKRLRVALHKLYKSWKQTRRLLSCKVLPASTWVVHSTTTRSAGFPLLIRISGLPPHFTPIGDCPPQISVSPGSSMADIHCRSLGQTPVKKGCTLELSLLSCQRSWRGSTALSLHTDKLALARHTPWKVVIVIQPMAGICQK